MLSSNLPALGGYADTIPLTPGAPSRQRGRAERGAVRSAAVDREPSEQSQREQNAGVGGDAAANAAAERYGPLALEREVKDDGRALLLYQRAQGARA